MGRNNSKIPPDELNQLLNATYFNAKEVKRRYSGFLIDCPSGTLNREQFIDLYVSFYASTDAKKFAEHVFRTFDNNGDGKIDFHEFISSLSITTRGTIEEKLEWIFKLYDIDRNGFITLEELTSIVDSVKNMVGLIDDKRLSKENVQRIFDKLDKNSDGKLSLKEFIDGAREDESFVLLLQAYTPR